jgi:hypothetical protein
MEYNNTSNIDSEEFLQREITELDAIFIINSENYSLEEIVGIWLMSTPISSIEIEFTNNNIFFVREFDMDDNFIDKNFYPYRMEENNIIIGNTSRSNKFSAFINDYFFSSGSEIYIEELDIRKLIFVKSGGFTRVGSSDYEIKNWAPFYKMTMENLIERQNTNLNYENKLKNFIYNEILNGIIFQGDINDENGVIDTYGVPLNDEVIEYSDALRYEGGMSLIGIREIVYEDLTHRYYVFFNRSNIKRQFYVDVSVKNKLDRLETINIGVASEEIIAAFGSNYWRKDGEDIIYMWGGDGSESYRWVRFSIENDILINIFYVITSWQ